jgi:DNA polymerase I
LKNPDIIKVESGYKNLFNKPVKKVTTRLPRNIKEIRDSFKTTYEADILFNNRYLIDNVDKLKNENLIWIGDFTDWRKCYIDIETTTAHGFPNPKTSFNEITAITLYDSYQQLYHIYVWRKDLPRKNIIQSNCKLYFYTNEIDMLRSWLRKMIELRPDIILGWNVIGFDIPYIINRFIKLKMKYDITKISPIKQLTIRQDERSIQATIGGIAVIDEMSVYRQTHKGELRSFSLRAVGLDEFNIDKGLVNAEDYWKSDDINKIIDYNKLDVELTVKLDDKRRLTNWVTSICNVAKCNIDDVKYYSRVSDVLVLNYTRKHKIVLPSKPTNIFNSERKRYEGAFVIANPGLYENVASLDFTSLYPNILKSFNLSLETIDENGSIDAIKCRTNPKPIGIIPSVIDELINLRKVYKNKSLACEFGSPDYYIWDAIQQATKNLYCVLGYGVNAYVGFRMYDVNIAAAITSIGQSFLKETIKYIESRGYKVCTGDTDSTYIVLGPKFNRESTTEQIKAVTEEVFDILKELNLKYIDWCKARGVVNPSIEIKFEKVYRRFVTGTKKRWAGWLLWREGKEDVGLDIAGFSSRRSDASLFTVDFQKEVIKRILKGEPNNKLFDYISSIITDFKSGKYEYEQIAIPTKLNKSAEDYNTALPVIRGVSWSNQNIGTSFREGDKFKLIFTKGRTDAVCFEFNEQFQNALKKGIEIDMDYMVNRNIFFPIKTLFKAIKWNHHYTQLNNHYKGQTTLSSFV